MTLAEQRAEEKARIIAEGLWSVWWRDHIHTDVERKLAVFATKAEAEEWKREHSAFPEAKIRKLTISRIGP